MARSSVGALGAAFALVLAGGCGGENAASVLAKAPGYDPKGQTKCGVLKSQARPLIVEWPSADRMTLENKVREGVVAVRYQGCEMEVLDRCSVPAKYRYLGATLAQDKVVMKDGDDLYANLPVGAAKLEGKLARSGQLTVDMDLVGRYQAERTSVGADELQGDCAGATHFVYGVAVGAFDFYAGADATVGAAASVGGVGAGGSSRAQRETLTRNGDPSSCSKAAPSDAAPPPQCGALIRIEVVPLGAARTSDAKKATASPPPRAAQDGSFWCFGFTPKNGYKPRALCYPDTSACSGQRDATSDPNDIRYSPDVAIGTCAPARGAYCVMDGIQFRGQRRGISCWSSLESCQSFSGMQSDTGGCTFFEAPPSGFDYH